MFRNYFKIALRNISRYKGYSFINIAGLAVSIACAILIALVLKTELGKDDFHENRERIYRGFQKAGHSEGYLYTDNLPGPLAAHLKEHYAGIEETARLVYGRGRALKYGDMNFIERGLYLTDQPFFDIFSFELVRGDRASLLTEPSSIVITESIANKYFIDEDPIGKVMMLENTIPVTVTGVMKDMPPNTHLARVEILIPFSNTQGLYGSAFDSWDSNWPRSYVMLKPGIAPEEISAQISGVLTDNGQRDVILSLQKLKDFNLYRYDGSTGSIGYLMVFALVGLFVLLIACINFMNLTTARAQRRAREVGLRKVCGARKRDLIIQFFGESILNSLIALVVAVLLAELLLPVLNGLTGKTLAESIFNNLPLLMAGLGISLSTGILGGIYPSLYLSSFQAVRVLKGGQHATGKTVFRNALVVIQFSLSILLIIGTSVVFRQLDFIRDSDLGYNEKGLVNVYLSGDSVERSQALKDELARSSSIINTTVTSRLPLSSGDNSSRWDWEDREEGLRVLINTVRTDEDYIRTMGIKLSAGRDLQDNDLIRAEEGAHSGIILNETAVRQMKMEDPVGKWFGNSSIRMTIVGVVKDYHFESLYGEVEPIMLWVSPSFRNYLVARIDPDRTGEALAHIESTWKAINPELPFVYRFMEADLDRLYGKDQRLAKLFGYAAILAVFIACLGLLGLVSYMTERRSKEMGIRKVLGASVSGIVLLFTKDIAKWVLASNIIAWPTAWFLMDLWLRNFAFRTDMSPMIFIRAGVGALVIALGTVSFQAMKAANRNPIEAIKYE
ncbi:MAG: ABC transporter permease [Bacteroidales bacterium]|nr:ABC transporter permease [Candidatus Latescibacterota bacterium]